MKDTAVSRPKTNVQPPIYLACSAEDLIGVEMNAWALGSTRAAVDAEPVLQNITAIEEASERACDEALEIYIPLDLDRFRDVFIRAWCGGYCSRMSQRTGKPRTETGAADTPGRKVYLG